MTPHESIVPVSRIGTSLCNDSRVLYVLRTHILIKVLERRTAFV